MTITEAAKAIGVSKSAVHKAISRGQLAATLKPGRTYGPGGMASTFQYDIDPAEVERYRAARGAS